MSDYSRLSPEAEAETNAPVRQIYRSIQDIVFETLKDEILSGKLKPGDPLNTLELSKRLGVSRTPIREALNRLIPIGLVESIPHRGSFVRSLSVNQIIELYYIRAALSGICARLAARNLTASQKDRLAELCGAMETSVAAEDHQTMLERNYEFHSIIFKAAQAPRLESLALQYYNQTDQYRALALELPGRYQEVCEEHRRILKALVEGDRDGAEHHSREHYFNSARRIARSIGIEADI